ncbi:hypothetical protein D3C86_1333610 [compost metagenome]
MATQHDAGGTRLRHGLGGQVLALRHAVLQAARQRDPHLVALEALEPARARVVPHAVAGPHPFDAAHGQGARRTGRILVAQIAREQHGDRRNARMRMHREQRVAGRLEIEVVEKDERLDQLADVRGTDDARDRSVRTAPGAGHDAACLDGQGRQGFADCVLHEISFR